MLLQFTVGNFKSFKEKATLSMEATPDDWLEEENVATVGAQRLLKSAAIYGPNAGGKTVTMKLDIEKQKLFFKDDDTKRDAYDVLVMRVYPDGTRNFYEHHDLDLAKKTDNYEMDFSKGDGKGALCFKDDDEGNGFGDDPCTEKPNDKSGKPQ